MRKLTTEEYIIKAKLIHGDLYNYEKVNYINARTSIQITCKIHGTFIQMPYDHLSGKGCSKCLGGVSINITEFITKAAIKHNNKYDYSLVKYVNSQTKVKIICSEHGIFEQRPANHISGQGCPKCNLSKGELEIGKWLTEHSISYITQKRFNDCKNKKPLPFDFYLPEHNTCIEFDGEQHYSISRRSKNYDKNLKIYNETILRDRIKNEYCETHNIILIRISYKETNIIPSILNKLKL